MFSLILTYKQGAYALLFSVLSDIAKVGSQKCYAFIQITDYPTRITVWLVKMVKKGGMSKQNPAHE